MNPNQITITLKPGITFTGSPYTAYKIRGLMRDVDFNRPVQEEKS